MLRPRNTTEPAPLFHRIVAGLCCALLLGACGGDDDDEEDEQAGLVFFTTNQGAAATTRVVTSGTWLAFLADEATSGPSGTDLNGDGDAVDAVPIAVDTAAQLEFAVPAAARDLAWIGTELYVVVDEAQDALDWNDDMMTDDLVLLHWAPGGQLQRVDDLDARGSTQIASVGSTLFYAASASLAGGMGSSIRAIASSAPLAPQPVFTTDAMGPLRPLMVDVDEGLLLLALDEVVEARDLNGDLDDEDRRVLALLDGTGTAEPGGYTLAIRNLGLAGRSTGATPFRAIAKGPGDWLACFLVNELAQDVTNLNDRTLFPPSWFPAQCAAPGDIDSLDDVLHWVRVAAWSADPVGNPPVNTGLVGEDRVLAVGEFVATISSEAAEGGCSLNGDVDDDDRVLRWVRATDPPVPPAGVDLLRAIEDAPGGTLGAAELQGRFVATVNEVDDSRDIDGNAFLANVGFVGWLDPEAPASWVFDHEPDGAEVAFGIATWMGELPGRERLGVAFAESGIGFDINGDGDVQDSIPTFANFGGDPIELVFPGFGVACPPDNPGIVLQNGWVLYRVSEVEDALDWNQDADLDDFVMFRTRLSDGVTFAESLMNNVPGRPAADPSGVAQTAVGAVLTDEAKAGDLNGDGRGDGLVVRYWVW